ncbi:MAG: hypothetical protein QXI16_06730 [Sulfolobaceae archaeon]
MNSINIISILTPVTVNSLFEIAACVSDIRKHPIEEVKQRFIPGVEHQTVIDQTNIITKVNYSKDRKTIEKITFITYEVES